MASLKASEQGQAKIKQARKEKGWNVDDGRWLVEASKVLEPNKVWQEGGPYANGCSEGTWKGFLYGKRAVNTDVFKAFCKVLSLPWDEIVDRTDVSQTESLTATGTIAPDWRQLCLTMLERKRRLTVDYWLNGADRLPFEQLDFVPLGLLQQKKDQANRSIGYEVTESFDTEKQFFDEVLRNGKNSPKSQGRRLAIIGESGAGKTTLLLKIGFWMLEQLEQTDEVSIWIDGREVGTKPLHQYLKEWLQEASEKLGSLPPEWIANLEQHLEHGRICLLLDGIEEQGSQLIEKLTGWVGKCRVVLTCRTNIWNSSKDALEVLEFDTYHNLGLGIEQIKQCIDAWFANDAEDLWAELNKPIYHRIKDLVSNPLYLTFLCRTWQPLRKLPRTKAGLIQWFLNTDYDRSIPDSKSQKQRLINSLGQLAKQAIERGESPLSRSIVCSELGESDEDLFRLAIKQLGWLQRVSPYQEVYDFIHDSFKEYFAAKSIPHWDYFLKQAPHNPQEGTYLIFEPKWKEVILLWLGREDVNYEEKKEFINTLVNFEDKCGNYYNFRSYLLGAEAISELSKEHNKTREIINQIVNWSFGYFNIECQEQQIDVPRQIKEAAKAILPKTHRSIVVECLIDLLATPNEYTRIEVAESLGEIVPGHPQAIATLMSLIDQSYVPGIRIQAVIALAKIGKNNQEHICQIEPNHPKLEPVQVITKYTPFQEYVNSGKINPNSHEVIKSLINDVRFSADKLQQLNAVKNLGDTLPGYPETINLLIGVIINPTTDENVLLEAISSLGRIGKNDQNAIRLLISIIRDSQQNLDILEETVRALRYTDTSHQEAINTLINLIRTSPDKQISRGATRSLRQILQRHQSKPAVLALKNCLLEGQKDLDIYLCCYELLWLCAQNMAYKDFYEVWQGSKLLMTSFHR